MTTKQPPRAAAAAVVKDMRVDDNDALWRRSL
jgi:hypothetical protein